MFLDILDWNKTYTTSCGICFGIQEAGMTWESDWLEADLFAQHGVYVGPLKTTIIQWP